MPRTIEVQLYQFDELSDDAKEKAREWFRSCRDSNDLDYSVSDCVATFEMFGFTPKTREVRLYGGGTRREPCFFWELGYSQGDGAALQGSYAYAKGFRDKVYKERPTDETLLRIADDLLALQKDCRYSLTATTDGELFRSPEISFDRAPVKSGRKATGFRWIESEYWNDAAARQFKEVYRDLCQWAYDQIRTEDEYQSEDETIDESIRANEYEFTEQGKIA